MNQDGDRHQVLRDHRALRLQLRVPLLLLGGVSLGASPVGETQLSRGHEGPARPLFLSLFGLFFLALCGEV